MAIVKTLTDEYTFWEWQQQSDTYKDQFSLEGAKALFNYFDELSEDLNEPMEFDPIAWLCDFSEYDSASEAAKEYGYEEVVDLEPYGSLDLLEVQELEEAQAAEWLEDKTTVIGLDNGHVLIGAF